MSRAKKNHREIPLKELRKRREKLGLEIEEIEAVISEIESLPLPRDIDIGADFSGDNELIAEVIHKSTTDKASVWYQAQTIYCSRNRCQSCPHGPFIYKYRRKKKGEITVKFTGEPVFDIRSLANQLHRICESPPPQRGTLARQDNKKN
jgi:hypothetical protein